ncbi:hypothetical protein FOQG_08265 [Fusarium oxysporum f. sp. raphani 54005]|uniref:Uncharacterized protein n=1 Tax=Fusarium oxysporum f. sp. raphani 54005 TaxID=1089458 RepID=X0C2Q7_FUSOX|nr:hypothetical protein FOQG_08265 [Fusarium oxysporum f. sp. raphani 54005]
MEPECLLLIRYRNSWRNRPITRGLGLGLIGLLRFHLLSRGLAISISIGRSLCGSRRGLGFPGSLYTSGSGLRDRFDIRFGTRSRWRLGDTGVCSCWGLSLLSVLDSWCCVRRGRGFSDRALRFYSPVRFVVGNPGDGWWKTSNSRVIPFRFTDCLIGRRRFFFLILAFASVGIRRKLSI